MPTGEIKIWPRFTAGLDRRQAIDQLGEGFVYDASNVRPATANAITTDTGFIARGAATTLRGTPQQLIKHTFANGTSEVLLVTTLTFYKFVSASDEWWYVQGPAGTTVADAGVATNTYIDVAASTGFVDGAFVGLTMDDGTQFQTTINGAPSVGGGVGGSDRINLDAALPSASAIGKALVSAAIFTGSTDHRIGYTGWMPNNWLVFTNNVDEPQRYNGTNCVDVPGLVFGATTINKCKWVAALHNQLLLFNVQENGTNNPWRIRGSDIGDGETWDDSVGNAFYEDIAEHLGMGQRAETLGNELILYFERGIVAYTYIGNIFQLWRYDVRVPGHGLIAPGALVNIQGIHVFLDEHDVFAYGGGQSVIVLGAGSIGEPSGSPRNILQRSPIQTLIFGEGEFINPEGLEKSFMLDLTYNGELWLVYPNADLELVNILRYDLHYNAWFRRTAPEQIYSATPFTFDAAFTTWDDVVGTWDTISGSWDSYNNEQHEIMFVGETTTFSYTPTAGTDLGTAISWTVETGELRKIPDNIRVVTVEILAKGAAFAVELSEDGGATWEQLGTITPTSNDRMLVYRLGANLSLQAARVRLSGQGSSQIEWVAMRYTTESMRV